MDRYGVFTREAIPKGRKVIEYGGERITLRQANRRVRDYYRKHGRAPKREYFFLLKGNQIVDGGVGGTGAEFVNHHCEGNLRVRRIRGHILLFSLRRIRAGEELNYDYAVSPESRRMPCRCGSRKCRGTINAAPKEKKGAARH
ncbi:MAG TPA: SET domain-containing protein-lysine N-methyltransferase [Candidatus Acidoferrales bacterium]|nr:SET domain-containing protein-lysine N-methyltransferase [Candidatus Acidoferrales bacterium]